MSRALLQLQQVSKHYPGHPPVVALDQVSLDLLGGELVVLLGPSGSGKSTLLNVVGGLDRPTDGSLSFDGLRLDQADDAQLTRYRRDHVGFVFQFYNLVPSLTALENVALVTQLAGAGAMEPEEALAEVQLSHRLHHFPAQLSGGEQQRVAVARAIAKRPRVLLCDEPTGALDSHTGSRVLEVIEAANRRIGAATIVITHNSAIAAMGDRVIRLADGRVVDDQRQAARVPADQLQW